MKAEGALLSMTKHWMFRPLSPSSDYSEDDPSLVGPTQDSSLVGAHVMSGWAVCYLVFL